MNAKTNAKRPRPAPGDVDESAESEITIYPDGRVFAFGITRGVAEVLAALPGGDERTRRLLQRIAAAREPGELPR
jgi:hypothetical protein